MFEIVDSQGSGPIIKVVGVGGAGGQGRPARIPVQSRGRHPGRHGFDGIVSVVESRAGFRAPVKRSENHNCQYAVCIRCLITR